MYYIPIILLLIIYLLSTTIQNKENFNVWDYEFPLSNILVKDKCPIQGTIEDINNPSNDSCYRGYYIPYLFNVGTYTSEVQPQS